jgi:hypothetical protein
MRITKKATTEPTASWTPRLRGTKVACHGRTLPSYSNYESSGLAHFPRMERGRMKFIMKPVLFRFFLLILPFFWSSALFSHTSSFVEMGLSGTKLIALFFGSNLLITLVFFLSIRHINIKSKLIKNVAVTVLLLINTIPIWFGLLWMWSLSSGP